MEGGSLYTSATQTITTTQTWKDVQEDPRFANLGRLSTTTQQSFNEFMNICQQQASLHAQGKQPSFEYEAQCLGLGERRFPPEPEKGTPAYRQARIQSHLESAKSDFKPRAWDNDSGDETESEWEEEGDDENDPILREEIERNRACRALGMRLARRNHHMMKLVVKGVLQSLSIADPPRFVDGHPTDASPGTPTDTLGYEVPAVDQPGSKRHRQREASAEDGVSRNKRKKQ